MKSDEDVRMISSEAPILFAKAAEMFIIDLTIRAWIHTEDGKRRTLQKNDIAMAISKTDIFDFLIDIVPREDGLNGKKKDFGKLMSPQDLASQHYLAQLYMAQQQALQQQMNQGEDQNIDENQQQAALQLYQQQMNQIQQNTDQNTDQTTNQQQFVNNEQSKE